MAFLLAFSIIVALILATASLYRYGNVQTQHPIVTLSVLTAWSFSFLIVFTIPLDVTSVSCKSKPPYAIILNSSNFFFSNRIPDRLPAMHQRTQ